MTVTKENAPINGAEKKCCDVGLKDTEFGSLLLAKRPKEAKKRVIATIWGQGANFACRFFLQCRGLDERMCVGHCCTMTHRFDLRIYYEDTDLAGIVYYANYLKFIERARSEWVRSVGLDQVKLRDDAGIVFAVKRIEADYQAPARFDDIVQVCTTLLNSTGARIVLSQDVVRGDTVLFASTVTLVALSASGAPVRLPADVRRALG